MNLAPSSDFSTRKVNGRPTDIRARSRVKCTAVRAVRVRTFEKVEDGAENLAVVARKCAVKYEAEDRVDRGKSGRGRRVPRSTVRELALFVADIPRTSTFKRDFEKNTAGMSVPDGRQKCRRRTTNVHSTMATRRKTKSTTGQRRNGIVYEAGVSKLKLEKRVDRDGEYVDTNSLSSKRCKTVFFFCKK